MMQFRPNRTGHFQWGGACSEDRGHAGPEILPWSRLVDIRSLRTSATATPMNIPTSMLKPSANDFRLGVGGCGIPLIGSRSISLQLILASNLDHLFGVRSCSKTFHSCWDKPADFSRSIDSLLTLLMKSTK